MGKSPSRRPRSRSAERSRSMDRSRSKSPRSSRHVVISDVDQELIRYIRVVWLGNGNTSLAYLCCLIRTFCGLVIMQFVNILSLSCMSNLHRKHFFNCTMLIFFYFCMKIYVVVFIRSTLPRCF